MRTTTTRATLAILGALLSVSVLPAQDIYTGATNANWSDNGNWLDGSEPTLTDGVQFPSLIPGTGAAITLSAAEQALSLSFLNSYQLTGGDLTLGGTTSINVDPTFTASIGSTLAGAGTSLTKSGNGTLILTGANTFVGTFNITAGVVNAQNNTALGTSAGGTTVTAGAALELQNNVAITGETLALNGTGISSGGGLRNISGANSFTGTVTLGSASSIISDAGTLTLGAVAAGANALTVGGAGDISIGTLSGSVAWNKVGAGTVTLTADPSINGALTIEAGVLALNHSGTTDFAITIKNGATLRTLTASLGDTTSDMTIEATGIFDFRSGNDTMGGLAGSGTVTRGVAGTATLSVNNGNETTTFSGVIQNGLGTINLTKNGTGILTLTGTNTYTGTTTVGNGSLVVNGVDGSLDSAAVNIGDNNGGGESMIVGAVGDVVTGPLDRLANNANVTLNGSTTGGLTMNGPASGSGGNTEVIDTLTVSAGKNNLNLVAGTGNSLQLTTTNFARTNGGVLLVRGADLGGSGVGSTRLVSTSPNASLSGSGGADGTTSKSIIRYMVGDTSITGAGSGFLTHDAVTSVRLLTAAEYDSSIAGLDQPLRNVSSAGEAVTADVRINSLRLTGGGAVSVDGGTTLRVASGAILLVASGTNGGTITGPGTLDFGALDGVITLSQDTANAVATLDAQLASTGGITISRTNDAFTGTVRVGGANTAIGNFTVNQATVIITNAAALNDKYPMTVLLRAGGSILQLNGNNLTIRDLQASSGTGTFQNGAATAATLTTYLTGNRSLQTVLSNGGTGALNLIVSSGVGQNSILTIDADASATGTLELRQGTIVLSGTSGTLNDFTGYSINGGTIRLASTSTTNNTNRLRDASAITFNTGTLDFDNNASAGNFSETVGAVTLASGANAIAVDKAASGQTSVLTLTSLARTAGSGATLNISSQSNGTAVFDLGTTTQSRLVINGTVPNDDGILGGWATIDSAAGREFVKYVASGTISATALVAGDYSALASGPNPTQNVKVTATPAALTGNTEINSLNIQQGSATILNLGGNTLRVESGGIIVSGAFNATINNGTLTAGNGANTAGELIFHTVGPVANPVDVDAVIADNGSGVVTLVKTGAGALDLSGVTNTYTGRTYINGGTLRISSDANLGTAPGAAVADSLVISGGSTLEVIANMTLNANRGIAVGPGANIISISSGTAGNGRVLTYNGAISSTGVGEGSLQFKSNVAAGATDTGEINATLSSVNLTGSFRVDAGTVTVTGATTNIGRSLQVGMDGTATMTYNSAGGSLTVGKGINDTLDVGVNSSDVVATDGTLNVSALSNFTVRVDQVRIGRASSGQTGRGSLILAANNDIVAGTSFIVGDTNNSGNLVSNVLEFGQGINTITTRTFTVGGNKSRAAATVRAGGTVNLKGFAENTLDFNVGVYGNTGTSANTSTFDMTGGTLNASLNTFTIGQKTGGAAGGTSGIVTVTGTGNDITANNVVIGNLNGNASSTAATAGTLNFGGGAMLVYNDIAMASFVNNIGTPTSTGTLNITGGVITVGGNITRTVDAGFETRANSYIHVNGGTLDMQDQASGDTTKGNITASQLAFRSGSIVDVEKVTLAASSSTLGTVPGAVAGDALILGSNLTASFDVELTGATGGNIHYVNTGSGATTLDGDVDLGTVNRIINVENTTLQGYELFINGVISNSAAITKQGTGTLALRGNNTYTGTTTVSAGTLQVGYMGSGSTGTGATTVNSGATLAGTGTVKGALVTHNINGNLSPGDLSDLIGMENVSTFGILKFEGNVIVGSSAVLTLHMGGGTTPGVNYDQITGLTAGATFVLDGTIDTADGSDNFLALPIYTPSFGETWHLIDWTTSLDLTNFNVGTNFRTGADAAADEGDLDLPNLSPYGLFWDVSNFANDGTVSIVPEPSRMLLLMAGVMGLVMRRRRKTMLI